MARNVSNRRDRCNIDGCTISMWSFTLGAVSIEIILIMSVMLADS